MGVSIPIKLSEAVKRIDPSVDVYKYLSNTPGDTVSDMAWRYVWFHYYFWNDLMPIYRGTSPFTVNDSLQEFAWMTMDIIRDSFLAGVIR